jgi:AraC-like DNA-binding protein
MSPLQYQKRMRLYESQRLMLVEHMDAAHAAYSVGYESINQFNREYKRLFGEPPGKNVKRLRTG